MAATSAGNVAPPRQNDGRSESTHATEDGPLAGYRTEGVDDERLSGGIAGVTGVLAVLVLAGGLTYLVRRRAPDAADQR